MRVISIIVIWLCIASACKQPEIRETDTVSIHLNKDLMFISPDSLYTSVRYIPLETTDESIFYEIDKIVLWNSDFYILDKKQAVILVFDKEGRYRHKLDKKGNGPGEYVSLNDFFISDTMLYVFSSDIQKILVYDMDFNFIRDFSTNTHATNIDYLDSDIFIYNNFYSLDKKNIYVMDKTSGKIKNKHKDFPEKQIGVGFSTSGFAKYQDSLYICFPYDYSIYKVTKSACEKWLYMDFGEKFIFDNSISTFSDDEREKYNKQHYSHICDMPIDGIDNLYISENLLFFTFVYSCSEYKLFMNRDLQKYSVGYIQSSDRFPFAGSTFLTIFEDQVIEYLLPESMHDFFEDSNLRKDVDFPRNLLQLDPAGNPVLCIYTLKNEWYEK